MSLPWFRMYAEFAADPIILSLSFDDQRHYIFILCMKCNGTLDHKFNGERRESVIRRGLGLDKPTADELKIRLTDSGLIDQKWQPLGWEKRQFLSDQSTKRVRKYRINKKSCNVSVTEGETDQNRTDKNITEQNKDGAKTAPVVFMKNELPSWLHIESWGEWVKYRAEVKKPLTPIAIKKHLAILEAHKNHQQEIIEASIVNGWRGLFPPKGRAQSDMVVRGNIL